MRSKGMVLGGEGNGDSGDSGDGWWRDENVISRWTLLTKWPTICMNGDVNVPAKEIGTERERKKHTPNRDECACSLNPLTVVVIDEYPFRKSNVWQINESELS